MVPAYRLTLIAALAAALAGCGRKPPEAQAASAAHDLLAAVWSNDAAAFEAQIDRPAVRQDLRRQLAQVAQASMLSVEGGASDAVLDRMISPQAFRLADPAGAPLAAAPSEDQLRQLISPIGKDRACMHRTADLTACLLTFSRGDHGWKLVGMAPAGFTIAVPPAPAAKG
jgi:hypothetical protein